MLYDLIIIGAGAAGLFAGASLPCPVNGLIIERKAVPGSKLLMSGSGQCNLTHGGSIKDFIPHYGKNGNRIRSILYRYNNRSVIDFFEKKNIPLVEREDGKIFPKSLQARDILNTLMESCTNNGLQFCFSSSVDHISYEAARENAAKPNHASSPFYTVHCGKHLYQARKLIIAAGGCACPSTGSDGSFFSVLEEMGISVSSLSPALVPIYVQQYPYKSLSGISFHRAAAAVYAASKERKKISENIDSLLLTHAAFSGPVILNLSRYAHPGDCLSINYYPRKSQETIYKELSHQLIGNNKTLLTVLYEYFNGHSDRSPAEMPKRFLEAVASRAGTDSSEKASRVSPHQLRSVVKLISEDDYQIERLGGYEAAMVTAGGIPLTEINMKTMESKRFPGFYFAGEVLDIDGDTGGYNLQFAFASAHLAAKSVAEDS